MISSPDQLFRPTIIMAVFLGALAVPVYSVMRDWNLTSVFLTIIVITLCANIVFLLQVVATFIIALLIFFSYLTIRKYRPTFGQAVNMLNLVGLSFTIYYGYSHFAELPKLSDPRHAYNLEADQFFLRRFESGLLPDIYYIVLDGYGRADILRDFYQFDNSDFLQSLEKMGFIVPLESRSNYPKTALSIASTLNMEYIKDLAPGLDDYHYWWLMSPVINHSKVRSMLEQAGYQSISIATDWGITNNPTTNIYYSPFPVMLTDFESFLLDSTPLSAIKPLLAEFAFVPSYPAHRSLVEYNFATLAEIPELSGPKFIFAHITFPHPPFVLGAEGDFLVPDYPFSFNDANDFPFDKEHYRQGYVGQVQYTNNQLKQLIEELIDKSNVPPIIILQADHGPGMFTDFRSSEDTCLKERFSVFAAYHLPGINPNIIPQDITPVNLFRIIFNEYFGSEFPMLDRFHYYYKDTIYIFRAEDVTSQVDTCTRK